MEKVSIVLLNYNGYGDTIECINSIKQNEKKINYEIIVVDNKSTDNSIEKLKELEDVILIEADINGGFAYGNNIGIKYAVDNGAEYVLLLNNDTIITPNCISLMYKTLCKHNDLGVIGCRIMYYANKELINYIGGKINWFKATVVIKDEGKIYKKSKKDFAYTNFITGCCMLIKKETIEKVGYLPEEYFMYYEDVDYCAKVVNEGYKLGVCCDAVIYHKESASSGGKESPFAIKYNTRNRMLFMKKYKCYGIFTKLFFYSTRVIIVLNYKITKREDKLEALKEGIREGREIA